MRHDAVAGEPQQELVCGASSGDGARCGSKFACQLAIGAHASRVNGLQGDLECGLGRVDWFGQRMEGEAFATEFQVDSSEGSGRCLREMNREKSLI